MLQRSLSLPISLSCLSLNYFFRNFWELGILHLSNWLFFGLTFLIKNVHHLTALPQHPHAFQDSWHLYNRLDINGLTEVHLSIFGKEAHPYAQLFSPKFKQSFFAGKTWRPLYTFLSKSIIDKSEVNLWVVVRARCPFRILNYWHQWASCKQWAEWDFLASILVFKGGI